MVAAGRSWLRVVAVAVLAGVALMLGAAPAIAHTRLESSNPADGASVSAAPGQVTLAFNQEMKADFSTITVIGPDGATWQTGLVSSGGKSVSTQVRPLGPVGRYDIGYRVLSEDGHPVTGKLAFTLTAPGPGASATAPAKTAPGVVATSAPPVLIPTASGTGGDSAPIWPWLAGGIVVIAGGVATALRLGRRP